MVVRRGKRAWMLEYRIFSGKQDTLLEKTYSFLNLICFYKILLSYKLATLNLLVSYPF